MTLIRRFLSFVTPRRGWKTRAALRINSLEHHVAALRQDVGYLLQQADQLGPEAKRPTLDARVAAIEAMLAGPDNEDDDK